MQKEVKEKPRYAIAASVQLPGVSDVEFEASLTELRELAKTLGFTVTRTFTQKRSGFDSTAYLGVGKRQEIRRFVNSEPVSETGTDQAPQNPLHRLSNFVEGLDDEVSPHPIDVILVDHEISPSQARNLENEIGCDVLDRTMVILEIFHRQCAHDLPLACPGGNCPLALSSHRACVKPRRLAGPQGRQRSGMGGRGAGESATELDRREDP
jgi:GTPase